MAVQILSLLDALSDAVGVELPHRISVFRDDSGSDRPDSTARP